MLRFLGLILVIYVICDFAAAGETGSSLEDLKDDYMDIVQKCITENYVTEDELKAIREGDTADNPTIKCLFACAYKKTGMMDDKGYFSIEGVRKSSEKHISEDPDILKKTEKYIEACKSVNDVPVSDGIKGCERAALLYKCSLEKASDIKIDLSK